MSEDMKTGEVPMKRAATILLFAFSLAITLQLVACRENSAQVTAPEHRAGMDRNVDQGAADLNSADLKTADLKAADRNTADLEALPNPVARHPIRNGDSVAPPEDEGRLGTRKASFWRKDKGDNEESGKVESDDLRQLAPMPSLAPLVRKLGPAVVNIYSAQTPRSPGPSRGQRRQQGDFDDFFDRFFGAPMQRQPQQSLGSGFLIGEGFLLTNNHVIDRADEIKVKLNDGRELDAKLVGSDPSTDVALLRLMGDEIEDIPALPLGDSEELEVGDYVVAIGNPFGLSHTVTSGIVSAKGRVIGAGPYDNFIQTDASINPGNSGGPLFNLAGEVVGINTAIAAHGQGIGFAVPVNLVKELLPQLRDSGRVSRGWLGVGLQELDRELAQGLGLPSNKGALVAQVFPHSPAQRAGVENGDVVVEFNGRKIESHRDLTRAVGAASPGSKVKAVVIRNGKERPLTITLSERDEDALAQGRLPEGRGSEQKEESAESRLTGLSVAPIPPELAHRQGISPSEGLWVQAVEPRSAADLAGVKQGDILLELQRVATGSMKAFDEASKRVKPGKTVIFRVRRGQGVLYLATRVPKE